MRNRIIEERIVEFADGLTRFWPEEFPLPDKNLVLIEGPNAHHKGLAIDRQTRAYHHCVPDSTGAYSWRLADDVDSSNVEAGYA